MSRKLASQALDALLNQQSISSSSSRTKTATPAEATAATASPVKSKKSKKSKKDMLPKTKTGLKKIKHELRYGHSVKRAQEEKEAKENPLHKLKSQIEKEEAIVEKNLEYYKVTQRVSPKELELRKKIRMLREKSRGDQVRKQTVDADESDGDDF